MTNSVTLTNTETFTIANAKYLASRIASDLNLVKAYHGHLTEQQITDFAVEAAVLLKHGLLDNVKYGFQVGNEWVFALFYKVNHLNQLAPEYDTPGSVSPAPLPQGATWHSFLTTKTNPALEASEVTEIRAALPIQRVTGTEPGSSLGTWETDKKYGANGVELSRSQFRANV